MPDAPETKDGDLYQMVAQSAAIAVQDAADNLRNIGTITSTAIGVAMAQLLANEPAGDPVKVIAAAQESLSKALDHFVAVGTAAEKIIAEFPRG